MPSPSTVADPIQTTPAAPTHIPLTPAATPPPATTATTTATARAATSASAATTALATSAALAAPATPAASMNEERRLANDGKAYTKKQFQD